MSENEQKKTTKLGMIWSSPEILIVIAMALNVVALALIIFS